MAAIPTMYRGIQNKSNEHCRGKSTFEDATTEGEKFLAGRPDARPTCWSKRPGTTRRFFEQIAAMVLAPRAGMAMTTPCTLHEHTLTRIELPKFLATVCSLRRLRRLV